MRLNRILTLSILTLIATPIRTVPAQESAKDEAEPKTRPNVILITLDTVRASSLGCYGHKRDTSPSLDALAKVSTLYTNAISNSNWTHPTHISLFTGRFTFEHGARYLEPKPKKGAPKGSEAQDVALVGLPEDGAMLAEVFKSLGYDTGAFITNHGHLHPVNLPGINRGFDVYSVPNYTAGVLNNQFMLRWLVERRKTPANPSPAPFFMFVNYMDAHTPYNTTPIVDWIADDVHQDTRHNEIFIEALRKMVPKHEQPEAARAVLEKLELQYDAGIRNLDDCVGQLVERLRAWELYDNTMIIVTSDHGEFFGENGYLEHVIHVYQPGIHIPLVIKYPGQKEGRKDEAWVVSPDIPGMIFRHMPKEIRDKWASEYPYLPGNHPVIAEQYYSRLSRKSKSPRNNRILRTIIEAPWKFIESSTGTHELYNLESDPEELKNVLADNSERGAAMHKTLKDFMAESPFTGDGEGKALPEPTGAGAESLKALGYL